MKELSAALALLMAAMSAEGGAATPDSWAGRWVARLAKKILLTIARP